MYRLLSIHVLALIDDSVISIEMYNVVHCPCTRNPLIPSVSVLTFTMDAEVKAHP